MVSKWIITSWPTYEWDILCIGSNPFTNLLLTSWDIQVGSMGLVYFHQHLQVPKMEGFLNLIIRLFWGWVFPYISRLFLESDAHQHVAEGSNDNSEPASGIFTTILCSAHLIISQCYLMYVSIIFYMFSTLWSFFKGQLGVPLTVYPWYLLCSLGIIVDYKPYNHIGISHRGKLPGVHPTIPDS